MVVDIFAFADELEKIGAPDIAALRAAVLKAVEATKVQPNLIRYPAAGLAGITGWEGLKTLKRQRDLGAAMEAQMEGQQ